MYRQNFKLKNVQNLVLYHFLKKNFQMKLYQKLRKY